MKDLLNRVQQQLNENHAVEAEDIQALVDKTKRLKKLRDKVEWLQVYYSANTDEDYADIIKKTLDDVLDVIDGNKLMIEDE